MIESHIDDHGAGQLDEYPAHEPKSRCVDSAGKNLSVLDALGDPNPAAGNVEFQPERLPMAQLGVVFQVLQGH